VSEPWALVLTALDAPAVRRASLAGDLSARADLAPRSVLLSTCHRVELYGFGPRPAVAAPALSGEDAVRRVVRIAAGLESASLGEDEVLHQLRSALAASRSAGLRDGRLIRLMETAIAAGRRTRAAGKPRSRSLEVRSLDWLGDRGPVRRLLVVGAGRMGGALAAEGARRGAEVTMATRTASGSILDLAAAAQVAHRFDAVAVALSGPWAVAPDGLPPVVDLSAPGALPAATRLALGDHHLGIDDLFAVRDEDPVYAARALALVERSVAEYVTWLDGRKEVTA
jgi:hypothetical protein